MPISNTPKATIQILTQEYINSLRNLEQLEAAIANQTVPREQLKAHIQTLESNLKTANPQNIEQLQFQINVAYLNQANISRNLAMLNGRKLDLSGIFDRNPLTRKSTHKK